MMGRWGVVLGCVLCVVAGEQRRAVNLHVLLTLTPSDDRNAVLRDARALVDHAMGAGMEQSTKLFLRNMVSQLEGLEAAEEELKKEAEKPPETFTTPSMEVKGLKKLRAKKQTVKASSFEGLSQQLREGTLKEPLIVRDANTYFPDWNATRRVWTESRLTSDPALAKLQLEYFEIDQQREAMVVGNQIQMPEPKMISLSGWFNRCFGKGKTPGAATEHCEQILEASTLANDAELAQFGVFGDLKNTLHAMGQFKQNFIAAGGKALAGALGLKQKAFQSWAARKRQSFQYVVMGPSGSGEKLRAEEGLPFFDILVHGARRWLLVEKKHLMQVAKKAQEALEFQETTAYMFFEEKLPELKEEFGFKKFVEVNQGAGDLIVVPPGWYRVSLSTSDSVSFYETVLTDPDLLKSIVEQDVFLPQLNRYDLAFCYPPAELPDLPGFKDKDKKKRLAQAVERVALDERVDFVVNALMTCGSVLGLEGHSPHLHPRTLSLCTEATWSACRGMLASLMQDLGRDHSLSWLPSDAPASPSAIAASTAGGADEL
eukprot:Hpha_TRINITY_DN6735_c0_g1::TRINITY_DN6735_c0_g1_i1::g.111060::m.111060